MTNTQIHDDFTHMSKVYATAAREAAMADMRRQQCLGRELEPHEIIRSSALPSPVSMPHGGAVEASPEMGVDYWRKRFKLVRDDLTKAIDVRDQLARRCAEQARHIADLLGMQAEERPTKPAVLTAIEAHQKAGQR